MAERYDADLQNIGGIVLPKVPSGYKSSWAQYTLRSTQRESIRKALSDVDIPTGIYYPKALHLQTAFAYLGGAAGDFPVAEQLSSEVFSLPMHPYLGVSAQQKILSLLLAVRYQ